MKKSILTAYLSLLEAYLAFALTQQAYINIKYKSSRKVI